jgi:acyl transferase domain-containing protein
MSSRDDVAPLADSAVAVVGLAGRFPRAKNLEEFWQNLRDGVEAITFFSDEELEVAVADPALLASPAYVKAGAVLDGIELFDAAFFGYSPREAELIDPQQRLFLECAWEALESAGYDPETYRGLVGVYGGVGRNDYLFNIYSNPHLMRAVSPIQITIANASDYVTTRVSYKLNLKGPSVNVQTACSTSLVAVHLACQSLLNGECHLALAGGISLNVPQKSGYWYEEGGIDSPDGHCRAYDARARGTVSGNGGGVVALKRLADALADGDHIHAVIRGSAINNDGSLKVGFTAPSVTGQAEVIAEALAAAGVDADTITYVEGHGTGTSLGDPIEVAALTQAFRAATGRKGFCALGSVKTNIGHLDTGAGVAGLFKAVLALRHGLLPPSLHYEQPNPEIDFAASPFYVNATLKAWTSTPRRAGVSSFGIGGTNAHVVLEEAPEVERRGASRPHHLLVLSARTSSALEAVTTNLAEHLKRHESTELADVAYTLQVGRTRFAHRRALVCRDLDDAIAALTTRDPQRVFTLAQEPQERPVVYLLPGQGSQYVGMGRDLYEGEPRFRRELDRCAELLRPHLDLDVRAVLYPASNVDAARGDEHVEAETDGRLNQTWLAQPALFCVSYALGRLWQSWGVRPAALVGHSLGEYVAACLAGVFTLEEALALVAARGRLMQQMPAGAMLSVGLGETEVRVLLGERLALAAVNAPALCVVSGPVADVDDLQRRLERRGVYTRRLITSHAFHSAMMTEVAAPFLAQVESVKLQPPRLPYLSNVTGTWITAAEATDPHYWVRHMLAPVRFADSLRCLAEDPQWVYLEVGAGNALATFARRTRPRGQTVLTSLRQPREQASDVEFILKTLGRLWLAGVGVDWAKFNAHARPRRVPLPTYPFERKRYWIERRHPTLQQPDANAADSTPAQESPRETGPTPRADAPANAATLHPRPDTATPYAAPASELEQRVAALWQEQLGIAPIGADDNFFELGGDSLLVTRIVSRLRDAYQVDLQVRHFFEHQTVAALAACVERLLLDEIAALSEEDALRLLQ